MNSIVSVLNSKVVAYMLKYGILPKRYRNRLFPRFQGHELRLPSRMLFSRSRVVLNLGDYTQYWMFMEGAYERSIVRLMRKIAGGKVFLDAGANVGTFTLSLHPFFREIHAFEASSANAGILRRNIESNGIRNVRLAQRVLGMEDGRRVRLFLAPDATGNHSVYRKGYGKYEEVETLRLDTYVRENGICDVGVLKIDVEGAEWDVFRGATEMIRENRPFLFLEMSVVTSRDAGWEIAQLYDAVVEMDYVPFIFAGRKVRKFSYPGRFPESFFENMVFVPREAMIGESPPWR